MRWSLYHQVASAKLRAKGKPVETIIHKLNTTSNADLDGELHALDILTAVLVKFRELIGAPVRYRTTRKLLLKNSSRIEEMTIRRFENHVEGYAIKHNQTVKEAQAPIAYRLYMELLVAAHDAWVEQEMEVFDKRMYMVEPSRTEFLPIQMLGFERACQYNVYIEQLFEMVGIRDYFTETVYHTLYAQMVQGFKEQYGLYNRQAVKDFIAMGEKSYGGLQMLSKMPKDLQPNMIERMVTEFYGIGSGAEFF